MGMNPHERVLHDVLGLLGGPTDHRRQPQCSPLMTSYQLAEGSGVAAARARQQLGVIALGHVDMVHRLTV